MSSIVHVHGRQILDSRGNPTVEVEIGLDSGAFGSAAVPSGASTGEHEAVELRDGGDAWAGKGVLRAVGHVNGEIADRVSGLDARDQRALDRTMVELDGTPTKSRLGANAILGVSLAAAKAAAADAGMPLYRWIGGTNAHVLPVPMLNVVNGGAHAQNSLDFQEFMLVPAGAGTGGTPDRRRELPRPQGAAQERGLSTSVGDEGASRPTSTPPTTPARPSSGAERAGTGTRSRSRSTRPQRALPGRRHVPSARAAPRRQRHDRPLVDLADRFPIISIEDGLAENDWATWQTLTDRIGGRIQLVGDDLFVTNVDFLRRGIAEQVGNAILVKVNQIGSLTETFDTIELAQRSGYATVISHRSGETEDATIADIAVATTPANQDRRPGTIRPHAKHNQLLRIEDELGRTPLPGWDAFPGRG
jgi:enolase